MSQTELGQKLSSYLRNKKMIGHMTYSQMETESGVPRSVIERFVSGTAEISGYYVFRLMEYAQADLKTLTTYECLTEMQIDCLMRLLSHVEWLSDFPDKQKRNCFFYLLKAIDALSDDRDEERQIDETELPHGFHRTTLRMEEMFRMLDHDVSELLQLVEKIRALSDTMEQKAGVSREQR